MNRKTLKVSETRVARAEIIERYAHAEFSQLCKGRACLLEILEEHRFGDFDFKPVRRQTGARESLGHEGANVIAAELDRREVDSDGDVAGPSRTDLAGTLDHPASDLDNEAHFLGD